jgi:hypothetical protein
MSSEGRKSLVRTYRSMAGIRLSTDAPSSELLVRPSTLPTALKDPGTAVSSPLARSGLGAEPALRLRDWNS